MNFDPRRTITLRESQLKELHKLLHVEELIEQIRKLKLARPGWFDFLSAEDLAASYNGCGPDSWPDYLRGVATAITAEFEAVWLIHDAEFAHRPFATYEWRKAWTDSTKRAAANCYKIAMIGAPSPIRHPWQYLAHRAQAVAIRQAVTTALSSSASWSAYQA